jgi:hypothetical protein
MQFDSLSCSERNGMIRQAISCDLCGAQRRETNHWFIAYEQSGELRVSDWTSQHLHYPGTKHLCGESCLHQLLGEFLANSAQTRTMPAAAFASTPSEASAVHISGPAEPLVSRSLRTQLTSTFSRSSQHSNREEETLHHKCAGRKAS